MAASFVFLKLIYFSFLHVGVSMSADELEAVRTYFDDRHEEPGAAARWLSLQSCLRGACFILQYAPRDSQRSPYIRIGFKFTKSGAVSSC
jgi:hypothetical protein